MASDIYRAQVQLLVRALPLVAMEKCFALKGGTAINLFIRDMPRLSVDIDLTYLPIQDRAASLIEIEAALARVQLHIVDSIGGARVTQARTRDENTLTGLSVVAGGAQIKIEVTPVLRGCVFAAEVRSVSRSVEDAFGFAEIQVVSFADLYAGKLVAALDRQHPRDLFDVHGLLRHEGVDDALRAAFVVYLISHGRPMAEVLSARPKNLAIEFERGFEGMTQEHVTLDALKAVRDELVQVIVAQMPEGHRRLLLSIERGEPDWTLLGLPDVPHLPAVQWRLQNIRSLDAIRSAANVAALSRVLGLAND